MALIEWKKKRKSLLLNKKSWISFRDNRLIFWFCLFYLAILKKSHPNLQGKQIFARNVNKIVNFPNYL